MMKTSRSYQSAGVLVIESEWTDEFGVHFEVKARGKNGIVASQWVTRDALGWPLGRDKIRAGVILAAIAPPAGGSVVMESGNA